MQKHLGIMKEEAELGRAEAHHEEVGEVPRNETSLKTNKLGFRASDKNMSRCDSMMAVGAGGIVTCTRSKTIRIISVKSMSCDKLEACRLKIARASDKAPQGKVWKDAGSGLGEDRILQVRF